MGLSSSRVGVVGLLVFGWASGCGEDREGDDGEQLPTGITVGDTDSAADDPAGDSNPGSGNDSADTILLDVGSGETDGLDCQEGEVCDECVALEHVPCDSGTTELSHAIGLTCPGEPTVTVSTDGSQLAMGTRTGFGTTGTWAPREGESFAVLGSGLVEDLDRATPTGFEFDEDPTHCNDDLGGEYDHGDTLPAPLRINDVGGDCGTNPALIGTGDCSNTIEEQFSQGIVAEDYTELRIQATVPPSTNSLSYDFAFFSTEYPFYYGSEFNDMFVAWLESENWTGNISFDEQDNPISLNAGFLDYQDNGGNVHPEFEGTCMKRHAGTKWLSTTAPVTPGENITLVLAIFDLSDSALDSYVFLDNFQWGCDGTDKPTTKPVG
jgi:hypothetical protein